jgi:MOSC domain-containing protein YiiM
MDPDRSAATTASSGPGGTLTGRVVAVCTSAVHEFSKQARPAIRLLEGLGVEGDAHAGTTVQHRSRVRRNPSEPNLRQVHLVHTELFDEVARNGHQVRPGDLGENVTTTGVDLLGLPVGTVLHLGDTAEVEVTGLRNPCHQIDDFQPGLLRQVLGRAADGTVVRRSGVMAVVRRGGEVRPGDEVRVVLPSEPHQPLAPV